MAKHSQAELRAMARAEVKQRRRQLAMERLDQSILDAVYANPQPPAGPWQLLWLVGSMQPADDAAMILHRRAAAEMMRFIDEATDDPEWVELHPVLSQPTVGSIDDFIYLVQWLVHYNVLTPKGWRSDPVRRQQVAILTRDLADAQWPTFEGTGQTG